MTKRNFIIVFSLLVMLFCGSTIGFIYAMTSVSVTNKFETGIVDIKLTEYRKVGDKEELWLDNPIVLPADKISKIPRVHNDGNDCYIRAKVTFRETEGELTEDNLFGITDKWVRADDGFYYYTEVLPTGKNVDIFQGVNIPKKLKQEMEGKHFYIDIDADAIQSKNFTPDFKSATPWGNVEILECEKEGMYDISTFKQSDNKSFEIEYQGESKKLITNSDDFFANIPYLMPGDKYSDSAKIVNNGKDDIKLYFRSEALDTSELLDKIQLKITTKINGKTELVYDGILRASKLSDNVLLGTIPAGKTGEFKFEISVPSELNNKYSILNSHVKWIFSTEPIKKIKVDKDNQTGDSRSVILYASIMATSLVGLYILRKKEEGDGNE